MHTCIHHRLQKTFWWCWFYRQYYTLQRQMADLVLAQSWQILGNAYYILQKSSVNRYCGYQQHGVSVSDSVSNSLRQAFPNQVQTQGLMTLVTVNGAFGLIGTCFIPAPASRMLVCLYLVPSYVQMFFQLVGRLAKFTGSLCLSEDAGHSHPP